MIKFGVISERKENGVRESKLKSFFKRGKVSASVLHLPDLDAEALIVTLPLTAEKMQNTGEEKLRKVLVLALKELKMWGVTRAVFTRELKQVYSTDVSGAGVQIVTGEQAFYRLIPQAVKRVNAILNKEKLSSKLGISDRGMSKITEYLIDKLCFDSKYISVYTDNLPAAAALREEVFDRTGLTIDVANTLDVSNNPDIMIDVDKRKVRVGRDFFVDGFEVDAEIEGYDVDSLELAECLGLKEVKIKYLRNGNKRLTI